MIPLRSDVSQAVRYLLGDTEVAAGQLYTDAFQAPLLNIRYQDMFQRLQSVGAARVQAEGYYLLPAYTPIFTPSLAGMSNFGGPNEVWERGGTTAYAISGAVPASPSAGLLRLTVAALPSTVVTGTRVEIYGIGGISADVNDSWVLTVNSPTSVDLNGCTATGTYVSGGFLLVPSEQWQGPLTPYATQDRFISVAPQSSGLACYSWQRGVMRFPECSVARELRILYQLSSSLPVVASPVAGDSMGVDDCLMTLATGTAELCAGSKGNKSKVGEMHARAEAAMLQLISNAVQQLQSGQPVVPAPFRFKRNSYPFGGAW
jgi:hypothetical protein